MPGEKNKYHFQKEDLDSALKFTYKWHLDKTKQSAGRTNQGRRGFGGEIDAFVPGKLLEIGCCKIIQRFTNRKIELTPDFKIYSDQEVAKKSDPDILCVKENGKDKDLRRYIEIKRLSDNDEWLGPRCDQLESFDKSIWKDLNLYMVHGIFRFDDDKSKKEQDITGSLLQRLFSDGKTRFEKFSNFDDLYCEIEFAYSLSDIKKFGRLYKKDEIIPTYGEGKRREKKYHLVSVYNKDGKPRKNYIKMNSEVKKKKLNMEIKGEKKSGAGAIYGDWELNGKFDFFKKDVLDASTGDKKYSYEIIHCLEETTMFNKLFGKYVLKKGVTYRFYLEAKGGGTKTIDDWWFLRRRLNELIKSGEMHDTETVLKEIAENI